VELSVLRQHCQQYAGLEKYTRDSQGLQAFITRLQNKKDSDFSWLESVAAFLGKVTPSKWRKENETEADYRLADLCERLLDLQNLHAHQLKVDANSDTKVALIRLISETEGEVNHIAYVDEATKKIADELLAAFGQKFENADKRVKLVVISQLLKQLSQKE
jgi:hypothetical protein